jgi:hypothetical protein
MLATTTTREWRPSRWNCCSSHRPMTTSRPRSLSRRFRVRRCPATSRTTTNGLPALHRATTASNSPCVAVTFHEPSVSTRPSLQLPFPCLPACVTDLRVVFVLDFTWPPKPWMACRRCKPWHAHDLFDVLCLGFEPCVLALLSLLCTTDHVVVMCNLAFVPHPFFPGARRLAAVSLVAPPLSCHRRPVPCRA